MYTLGGERDNIISFSNYRNDLVVYKNLFLEIIYFTSGMYIKE